jgi:hypothetical protein
LEATSVTGTLPQERQQALLGANASHEECPDFPKIPKILFSLDCIEMRSNAVFLAATLLQGLYASPIGADSALQVPLEDLTSSHNADASSPRLHGKFLHITGGQSNLIF